MIERRMVLAMLALLLTACSGKPSDAEVVLLFAEDNKRLDVAWLFDFANVKRINGYEQDRQHYVVVMEFDVIARMGYEETVEGLRRRSGDSFFARQQLSLNLATLQKEFGEFKKGQRFTKERPMLLQRTEAGWQLAG
jgi:hypothetical protein